MTQLNMPFSKIFEFEDALAEYTGAPYVITTDCCTHAIELALRYKQVKECNFSAHTYLSVLQTMRHLNIKYKLITDDWRGEYKFHNTNIWDSARRLAKDMYKQGDIQCISFGHSKPLEIGRGGAILTDDEEMYKIVSMWRSDGRDLHISPWANQHVINIGWHYQLTIEQAELGLQLLPNKQHDTTAGSYPDLRTINIY